jgi:hypothetical protein
MNPQAEQLLQSEREQPTYNNWNMFKQAIGYCCQVLLGVIVLMIHLVDFINIIIRSESIICGICMFTVSISYPVSLLIMYENYDFQPKRNKIWIPRTNDLWTHLCTLFVFTYMTIRFVLICIFLRETRSDGLICIFWVTVVLSCIHYVGFIIYLPYRLFTMKQPLACLADKN